MPPEGGPPTAAARTLTIAGAACVRLHDPDDLLPRHPTDGFGPPPAGGALTLDLTLTRAPAPPLPAGEPLFDSTSLWRVHRRGPDHLFALPHLTAVVDFPAGRGRIHLRDEGPAFGFPLDEVIFSRLLAERDQVIVHACGVTCAGRGYLLAGPSGTGKSTLADLWAATRGADVLSDDRVVIGRTGGRLRMAGTPWQGTARHATAGCADLTRLLLLAQADRNRHAPLAPAAAAARLLALCVIPYWDPPAAERALDAALDAIDHLPVGELGFVPDPSAVQAILQLPFPAGSD